MCTDLKVDNQVLHGPVLHQGDHRDRLHQQSEKNKKFRPMVAVEMIISFLQYISLEHRYQYITKLRKKVKFFAASDSLMKK
jgi:hypothetical protein